LFNDWHAKFYFNALVAGVVAVAAYLLIRDTPQSCGLPPVEEYKNDYPVGYSEASERTLGFREILFSSVLSNGYLWAIAVANLFCYFVRYGVENWIPTYLQIAKGYSFKESSIAWGLYEFAAIPGTIACGWVSERWFKRQRAPATILFMALTLIAVLVYWFNGKGPLWIDYAALIAIGFLIYGPIMIIGLQSLDLVPKKAAGTAAGFTGLFGYAIGSAISGSGVGWIADHWGWGGVFTSMVVCCLLTIFFSALTLGHRAQSGTRGVPDPAEATR
jgi:OPA family glycerol-3-phosphate transporter-like MFS transporter